MCITYVNVYFDAAIFVDVNVIGIGVIIGDGCENFLAGFAICSSSLVGMDQAGTLALSWAMNSALESGFGQLHLEGDSYSVINELVNLSCLALF